LQGVTHGGLACFRMGIKLKRAVAHRLPMRPNGLNIWGLQTAGMNQGLHHLGVASGQGIASQCSAMQFIVTRCIQTQEFCPK